MNKGLKIILLLLAIVILPTTTFIVYDGLSDDVTKSDFGVVLGNKVNEDGQPSDRLKARLDKVVELYKSQTIKKIIVSGGLGDTGFDEAKVMKAYLIEQNIPTELIIEDNKGSNTKATAENSKQWIKEDDTIVLISQFFHLTRSRLLFKKAGFKNITTAHANFFELRDIYSTLRETVALYYYYIFK